MTAPTELPNPLPRPPGELEALERAWAPPRGIAILSEINNSYIGIYYIGTAILFFLFAGVLALLMRAQLALPESSVVSPDLYNQLFTMHGTVMMFLFAVPAVEAVGVLLLPNMLGARDLPFPRLSAYAFWAYAIGGGIFLFSIFFDLAPRAGWFMYPPLSSTEFSPDISADFWLLGIGFIEISAIAGAIEIIVGILRTRAPGMTLWRLPVFAWAMLVFGVMIVFAFPSMIVGTLLLELERAFDWPFFITERGGDPLLWQHLFWFFGHPEVYIIFLPAAGMVSMIIPTVVRHSLVGYRLVVLALIGTGLLSFGLWVHHMFATGLPRLAMAFFSAAGMLVAIPSGIQVFAWIATFASGRLKASAPGFFLLGALLVFVIGGLTGVMVAIVPFDQQVHDTFFVVAHLHYVLIGGMVMPFLAAIYYWAPAVSRTPLSDRMGRIVAVLFFLGVNLTFLPMHITGLIGMPRRVYTYPAELGWGGLNLLSSIGAVVIAASIALFLFDLVRHFRPSMHTTAGNVLGAGTLEWAASGSYAIRSIPRVRSLEPLWSDPKLAEEIEAGAWYLPGTVTGKRETIVTGALDARLQYILTLPGPGWSPFVAAVFTAACFMLLTVKAVVIAAICGVIAVASLLVWMWSADPGPRPPASIGGGINLPIDVTGRNHAWSATIILILVLAAIFAGTLFTYVYLWATDAAWPPEGIAQSSTALAGISAVLLLASAALVVIAGRLLPQPGTIRRPLPALVFVAAATALIGATAVDFANLSTATAPSENAYGAAMFAILLVQGILAIALAIILGFLAVRFLAGRLNAVRRSGFDVSRLLVFYGVGQGLVGLAVAHLVPKISRMRLVATIIAIGAAGIAAAPAWAHGATQDEASSVSAWATTLAISALAILYAAGARRLRRGSRKGLGPATIVAFYFGCALFLLALASPLDGAADVLLSAHMVQHLVLVTLAPLLAIIGRPDIAFAAALPSAWARSAHRFGTTLLHRPILAAIVHGVAIWAWHAPPLFEAALRDPSLHALEHLSFVVTALWFWAGLLAATRSPSRRLSAAIAALATLIHSGLLGAILTFAPRLIYPVYADDAAALGVDPIGDQQLAGLIMWVPGGLAYLGAALWIATRLLNANGRDRWLHDPAE